MSEEPIWLTVEQVLAMHAANSGGSAVRRACATRACCDPRSNGRVNKWQYEQAEGQLDLAVLAAAYAFGLAQEPSLRRRQQAHRVHGDGRVSCARTACISLRDPRPDAAAIILALAAGEVSEESLTRWIRDNWPKA